jgi:hypothetical protein
VANGQYFPPGRGGNDPARQAAIQQLGKVPVSRPDVQRSAPGPGPGLATPQLGPGVAGPPMAGPGGMPGEGGIPQVGNKVAFYLMNAFDEIIKTPQNAQQNISAVQQFVMSVAELHNPQGAGPGGQAPVAGPPAPGPGMAGPPGPGMAMAGAPAGGPSLV